MSVARLIGSAEIVALDSMQVYRGMDIGTATPTAAEQAEVPHRLTVADVLSAWDNAVGAPSLVC